MTILLAIEKHCINGNVVYVHVSTCWTLLFFPQEIKELQQSASLKVVTQQEQISQLTSEETAIEEKIQTESEALQKQISAQQDWISTVRNILHKFSCELEIVFAIKSKYTTVLHRDTILCNISGDFPF